MYIYVTYICDIERNFLIPTLFLVPVSDVNIHVICSDCITDPSLSYKTIRAVVNYIEGSAVASSHHSVTYIEYKYKYRPTLRLKLRFVPRLKVRLIVQRRTRLHISPPNNSFESLHSHTSIIYNEQCSRKQRPFP